MPPYGYVWGGEWESGYTAKGQELSRSRATLKLAQEQNVSDRWEKT